MNICHILHRIYQREGEEFVAELYRQLLNREPDYEELLPYVHILSTCNSKISIVAQILSSQEAHDILTSPSPPLPTDSKKIIHILYRAFRTEDHEFVSELYRQLLGRNPDEGGLQLYSNLLAGGTPKIDIVIYILSSQEANNLLTSPLLFGWDRELHRDQKIKVLLIEDRIPATELGAGYPRSLKIVECLADLGYQVTLFPLQTSKKIQPYTHALQQKGVEVMFTNDGAKLNFRGFYENRKHDYHIVWVSRPYNLQEVIHVIQSLNPYQKIIYDAEALFSMREILRLELYGHLVTPERKEEVIHAEVQWMRQVNAVVAVSDLEKRIMESYGVRNVNVIGYPVRPNPTPKTFKERRDILFVGGFLASPSPNEDAILYFVHHIYPAIYQHTGAHLWIVGTNHLNSIRQLASDHIFVTGQVADLTPFYNDCRVFVAPTRYAAGIPLKMMEALAHGIPSVVTSLIGEQLEIDESSALIAQDASSFGSKVLDCYSNKNIWQTLRDNGLQYVQSRCNEANFRRDLASLITGV